MSDADVSNVTGGIKKIDKGAKKVTDPVVETLPGGNLVTSTDDFINGTGMKVIEDVTDASGRIDAWASDPVNAIEGGAGWAGDQLGEAGTQIAKDIEHGVEVGLGDMGITKQGAKDMIGGGSDSSAPGDTGGTDVAATQAAQEAEVAAMEATAAENRRKLREGKAGKRSMMTSNFKGIKDGKLG